MVINLCFASPQELSSESVNEHYDDGDTCSASSDDDNHVKVRRRPEKVQHRDGGRFEN